MAGLIYHVNSGEVGLTAATAKTLLQVVAPANQRVMIRGLKLMGKQPAGGTDTPVKVRLTRSTSAFGTGTAATPAKNNPNAGETVQSACYKAFSAEPTSPTDGGLWWEVQPQSGVIEFYPPGLEIPIPGGQSAQFEAYSTGTPTLTATLTCEE